MKYLKRTNRSIITNLSKPTKRNKLQKSFNIKSLNENEILKMRLSQEAIVYINKHVGIALENNVIKSEAIYIARAGLISTGIEHSRKYGKKKVKRGSLVKGWKQKSIYDCIPGRCFARNIFSQVDKFSSQNPSFNDLVDL